MMKRIHTRSLVLGGVLGAGLCLLVAAAKNELLGPVGRYQVCCSQSGAYLVDTITGQVWLNSEREFRRPKLQTEMEPETPATERSSPARTPAVEGLRSDSGSQTRTNAPGDPSRLRARLAGFTGKWVLNHPTEGQLSIQIERDGRVILTQSDKSWEGKWQIEGNQITITTDEESLTGQIDERGQLVVKEGSGEPIAFQRGE